MFLFLFSFLLSCQIISLLFFFLLLLLFRRCLSEYGMITNNDVESSRTFSFRSESLERKTISITCNRVDNFSFRISKHARSSINTRDAYECLFSYIRDGIRLSIDNETSHSFSTSTKSNPTFPEEQWLCSTCIRSRELVAKNDQSSKTCLFIDLS